MTKQNYNLQPGPSHAVDGEEDISTTHAATDRAGRSYTCGAARRSSRAAALAEA